MDIDGNNYVLLCGVHTSRESENDIHLFNLLKLSGFFAYHQV